MKRKRIENNKTILRLLFSVLFGVAILAGCTDDAFESGKGGVVDQTGVPEGFVRARINLVPAEYEAIQTKTLDNAKEHEWSHVFVGQFDQNDQLVTVQRHEYGTNGNFEMLLEDNGEDNTLYFITNYGDKDGSLTDPDHNPFINPENNTQFANLTEFKAHVYTPVSADNAGISEGEKLVMVGSIRMKVDREDVSISTILVYVDKLTAKLDVLINAAQSIADPSHPFLGATLDITGLKIMNVPKHAAFTSDGKQISSKEELASIDASLSYEVEGLSKKYQTTESYYILENRMHANNLKLQPLDESQRGQEQYKNQAAKDHGIDSLATYLLIEGELNDGRNVGKPRWMIYLGENNLDNFNINRNTHYTITVQIDGAGIATSDIRVDKEKLYVRELRYLNGRYGSNRSPETSYSGPNDLNWGNQVAVAKDKVANSAYLYMDAGDGRWSFDLTNTNGIPITNWSGLSVSYLPLAEPEATGPGTAPGMDPNVILNKWLDDTDESNWKLCDKNAHPEGFPSGVRVRVNIGVNMVPAQRTVDFRYYNVKEPDQKRIWRITQYATDQITILDRNFIPSEEGVYGMMVRATENTYWRLQSGNSTNFSFQGVVDSQGNTMQTSVGTGFTKGNGVILYKVRQYDGVPYRNQAVVIRTFDRDPNSTDPAPISVDKTAYIYQMGSAENLLATKGLATKRYVYDYSTDPLFETMFAFPTAIPIGINLVDIDYSKDESLFDATSTTDGKENTLRIFQKLEGHVVDETKQASMGLTAPPVFSPAGLCMMMNKEWWTITDRNDPKYEWYLPARYHGLMDATAVMLGIKGMGHTGQAAFWTSTAPQTRPTQEQHSVYFAGTTVDVSANYSTNSTVRCVRDKKVVGKSYPYLTEDYAGNPVIVTYEEVDGVPKGYVDVQTGTNVSQQYYKLGKPLRFTRPGQVSNEGGQGPSDPNWSYLSPKFRVAKQDAPIRGSDLTGPWPTASGWSNENAVNVATPATGCAAYVEDGTGWRLPSELEMRLILLLGGGVGSESDVAKVPVVQEGGKSFLDFKASGFNLLGTTNGTTYWVNRKYPNDNRAVYFTVSGRWANAISGSATDWKANQRVRCVRDI